MDDLKSVRRWEYFIGDRPHTTGPASFGTLLMNWLLFATPCMQAQQTGERKTSISRMILENEYKSNHSHDSHSCIYSYIQSTA